MAGATANGNGSITTLANLAKAKRLPVKLLRDLGVEDLRGGGVSIPYYDAVGNELFRRTRGVPGLNRPFNQPAGVKLQPYGQERLGDPRKVEFLVLVEGESDCWTLWHHKLPALGCPGAGTYNTLQAENLEGIEVIYISRETDKAGEEFVSGVTRRLLQLGYKGKAFRLDWPEGCKDPSDLHILDSTQFKERLGQIIDAATLLDLSPPKGSGRAAGRNGQHQSHPDKEPEALATTCLATLKMRPIRWLVPDYLPLGKLVLIAGDGGHGKSALTLYLAARLSVGAACFGLTYEPGGPCDVLLVTCEDDTEDTILPRLLAMGADLSHIHRVDGIRNPNGKPAPFSLAHYESMGRTLRENPNIRAIIIDPAGAFVGRTGIDDHKDSELRALLGPMTDLAATTQVTMLLVKHLNRNVKVEAVHRVMGSAGYVNTVRMAYIVAPDKDDKNKRHFLPIKSNITRQTRGLVFDLADLSLEEQETLLDAHGQHLDAKDRVELARQLFSVRWFGQSDVTPNDALGGKTDKAAEKKTASAGEWLLAYLAEYAAPSEIILAAGQKVGFSRGVLFAAKKALDIRAGKNGFKGEWYWGLGPKDQWRFREVYASEEAPYTSYTSDASSETRGKTSSAPPKCTEASEVYEAYEVCHEGEA